MENNRGNVAVFLSGRGSNFEAIYKNSVKKNSNYNIVVVISDNPDAKGLKTADKANIPAFAIPRCNYKKKKDYENEILNILRNYKIDLICLAGYMRILGKTILKEYRGKIINIHPSLLPSFPGLNAQRQAIEYGVKISGCTVHFVDSGIDTGKIIAQTAVKVFPNDSVEELAKRILDEEHKLYPEIIRHFFNKKIFHNNKEIK
jgi:phosphoribosylglycinamide formyltransferase-1